MVVVSVEYIHNGGEKKVSIINLVPHLMNSFCIHHNSIYLHLWVMFIHPTDGGLRGLSAPAPSPTLPLEADCYRLHFQAHDSSEWMANGKSRQVIRGHEEGRSHCILLPPSLLTRASQPIYGFGWRRADPQWFCSQWMALVPGVQPHCLLPLSLFLEVAMIPCSC